MGDDKDECVRTFIVGSVMSLESNITKFLMECSAQEAAGISSRLNELSLLSASTVADKLSAEAGGDE